jgi:hypothetical protein
MITEIADQDCGDGVTFLTEEMAMMKIKEGAGYEGVRIYISAMLGKMKKRIGIDIGFGDSLLGKPRKLLFPVLLDDDPPILQGYPFESVISEKFHAIVWLNFQTSRMKDFYDIFFLASHYSFLSSELYKAILITFNKRKTDINSRTVIYSEKFKNDENKGKQWEAFFRKNNLEQSHSLNTIIDKLHKFIEPIFDFPSNENQIWKPDEWIWKI